LRDPAAAVRGLGASALVIEALVLLLTLAPVAKVGGAHRIAAIWVCLALVVVAAGLVGQLRRSWAWPAGFVVPVALLAGGLLHWTLAVLGLLFGAVWGYVLYVRRTVLGDG
jgi:hypothetical protein